MRSPILCVSPSFIISDAQGSLGISVFGLFGHFWTVFLTFWSQNTGGKGGKEDKSGIRDYGRASIAVVINAFGPTLYFDA